MKIHVLCTCTENCIFFRDKCVFLTITLANGSVISPVPLPCLSGCMVACGMLRVQCTLPFLLTSDTQCFWAVKRDPPPTAEYLVSPSSAL